MTIPDKYQNNLSIYSFILDSIRIEDAKADLFLQRFLQGPQEMWDAINERIFEYLELWDILNVEDENLQYLKNQVGWTNDLNHITDRVDDITLRKLVANAVDIWKQRGTEDILSDMLFFATGTRNKVFNWFDYRWVLDENSLGDDIYLSDTISDTNAAITEIAAGNPIPTGKTVREPLFDGGFEEDDFSSWGTVGAANPTKDEAIVFEGTRSLKLDGLTATEGDGIRQTIPVPANSDIKYLLSGVTRHDSISRIGIWNDAYRLWDANQQDFEYDEWLDFNLIVDPHEVGGRGLIIGCRGVGAANARYADNFTLTPVLSHLKDGQMSFGDDSNWPGINTAYSSKYSANVNHYRSGGQGLGIKDRFADGVTMQAAQQTLSPTPTTSTFKLVGFASVYGTGTQKPAVYQNGVMRWEGVDGDTNAYGFQKFNLTLNTADGTDIQIGASLNTPQIDQWFIFDEIVCYTTIPTTDAYAGNSEYEMLVKIVDTGTLDKQLVQDLTGLMRPSNETVNLLYYNLLDYFDGDGGDEQWDTTEGSIVVEDNALKLEDSVDTTTLIDFPGSDTWDRYSFSSKIKLVSGFGGALGHDMRIYFHYKDSDNYRYLRVQRSNTQSWVTLYRVIGGSPDTTGFIAFSDLDLEIIPLYYHNYRIEIMDEGSDQRIKVYFDENLVLDELDTTTTGPGTCGFFKSNDTKIHITAVENRPIPSDFDIVS